MIKASATVVVWDPLLRLYHWSLAAAAGVAWYTREQAYETHLLAGYWVLGLLVFRLLWGVVGGRYARFASFWFGPRATLAYLAAMRRGREPRHLGHNPAGAAMIFGLLLLLGFLVLSGVALDAAENRAGPLAGFRLFYYTDLIAGAHAWATDLLIAAVGLHLAGVAWSSRRHRENLPLAMLTGRKRGED